MMRLCLSVTQACSQQNLIAPSFMNCERKSLGSNRLIKSLLTTTGPDRFLVCPRARLRFSVCSCLTFLAIHRGTAWLMLKMRAGSIFIGASAALIISVSTSFRKEPEPTIQHHDPAEDYENEHHIVNWSETHECRPKRFYQPETHEELEALVAEAHAKGALNLTEGCQHLRQDSQSGPSWLPHFSQGSPVNGIHSLVRQCIHVNLQQSYT